MRVGVLAVQGAFIEHMRICQELGTETFEIRCAEDLEKKFDGLILPGGESTAQSLLLHQLGMFDTLRTLIENDLPVMGTCAGMILLAQHIENEPQAHFSTLPITVVRNGYGRQLGSFTATFDVGEVLNFRARFIRAPYISQVGEGVRVLARFDGRIVAAQSGNQVAYAFHPELGDDMRLHENFLRKLV